MSEIDTSTEEIDRIVKWAGHSGMTAGGVPVAALLRALAAERDALNARLDDLLYGRPDIAAILRGEAVAVLVEATEGMLVAGTRGIAFLPKVYTPYPRATTCYRAMLAASPYKQEQST